MNIAKTSIEHPVGTVMLMLAVILIGAVSFTRLSVDLLPNINAPVAAIVTSFPGASAQEVQDLVTIPIEAVASTASRVKEVTSISQEETSLVVMMFDWGTDVSQARADIAQKLDLLKLPSDVGKPVTIEFDPTLLPVMQVSVSKEMDIGELTEYVKDQVKPRLEAVEGVAAVDIIGGLERQVNIWLDPARLASAGLTQDMVAQMIAASNLNYPLGTVKADGLSLQMRMTGRFATVQEISDMVVGYAPAGGQTAAGTVGAVRPVLLKDIAVVEEGYSESRSLSRVNGKPGIALAIHRESTANTVSVARAVRKELDRISKDLDLDVSVSMDQARFIETAISAIENNLLIGAGLAVLVLLFFLRDVRTTLVISISIPFSLIAAFVLMYGSKLTLNIMTLGGLALGVGMLVDNSIVVIESIFTHTEMGEDPKTAAEAGTREVATAITASTLTTMIVFLPVAFVGGITGIIFKELGWTVIFSLFASLVVAITVVPMLASRVLSRRAVKKEAAHAASGASYERAVRWCLRNRALVILLVLAAFAGAAFLARRIPSEFLPVADEGSFSMSIHVKPGTPLEEVDSVVRRIEEVLSKEKTVESYAVTVGRPTGATFQSRVLGGWDAQILVTVTPETQAKKETSKTIKSLESKVDKVKGNATVSYNMQSSLMMMAGDLPTQILVRVAGPDIAKVAEIADDLVSKMKDVEGLKDVKSSLAESQPEIHLKVDKEKALRYGLTPAQIALAVSHAVEGQTVSRFQSGEDVLDVVLRYKKDAVQDTTKVGEIMLTGRTGPVLVKDVASIEKGLGPVQIARQDRRLSAQVTGQISERSLGSVSSDVAKIIDGMDIPQDYRVELGGVSQIMTEGFQSMGMAFAIAAALIYMVMAASFESLGQPLILMLTVPLGGIGAAVALYLGHCAFGITAFIGVIILAGVVVNNGIVMVDYMNQLRAKGLALTEAIVKGAARRLRPVLMTSITTIVGLIPMALGIGHGGELEAPLALSLMGGLTSGTFLTLFVIPVVYSIFTRERRLPKPGKAASTAGAAPRLEGKAERGTEAVAEAGAGAGNLTTARPGSEATPERLLLRPGFDSRDMAQLIELLGKLFSSISGKDE